MFFGGKIYDVVGMHVCMHGACRGRERIVVCAWVCMQSSRVISELANCIGQDDAGLYQCAQCVCISCV